MGRVDRLEPVGRLSQKSGVRSESGVMVSRDSKGVGIRRESEIQN